MVPFHLPLQSFPPPHPPPNDVLTKIRLRGESLNSVQKLNPKEVKGSLVSHISPNYFQLAQDETSFPKDLGLVKVGHSAKVEEYSSTRWMRKNNSSLHCPGISICCQGIFPPALSCLHLITLGWSAYLLFQPQPLLLSRCYGTVNVSVHPMDRLPPCYLPAPVLEAWQVWISI